MSDAPKPRTRRADYAEMTRQAIVDAARSLYASKGFFATTVEEIAAQARVAPATVYASGGGKHGLLHTLIDQWQTAPVIESTYRQIADLDDGNAIVAATASGTRAVREEWGDVVRVARATAPHDQRVADLLSEVTDNYRHGLALAAQRLIEVGALREEMDLQAATDVLWFYFGYSSYSTLTDENGWNLAQAEQWLNERARAALLP
jgi:AcrR family transcriptional regulator